MIRSVKQANAVKSRRLEAGKTGEPKAVRRWRKRCHPATWNLKPFAHIPSNAGESK